MSEESTVSTAEAPKAAVALGERGGLYRVYLMQRVIEECAVHVRAASAEEASAIALATVGNGTRDVTWHFYEAPDPIWEPCEPDLLDENMQAVGA